jgi:hypothetical protein
MAKPPWSRLRHGLIAEERQTSGSSNFTVAAVVGTAAVFFAQNQLAREVEKDGQCQLPSNGATDTEVRDLPVAARSRGSRSYILGDSAGNTALTLHPAYNGLWACLGHPIDKVHQPEA